MVGGVLGGWAPSLVPSLKLTAILHLKMDGWNRILSCWGGLAIFRSYVSFREAKWLGSPPCISQTKARNGRGPIGDENDHHGYEL